MAIFGLFKKEDKVKLPKEQKTSTLFTDVDRYDEAKHVKLGKDSEEVYNNVRLMNRTSLHLWGVMQTRILAILSLRQEVIGEGEEADFVKAVIENLKGFEVTYLFQLLLSSITSGFAVSEKVWGEFEGKWIYKELLTHAIKYFGFNKKNELVRIDVDPEKVLSDTTFDVLTFMMENNNRFGEALYEKVYWYWYMSKEASKFWAIFTERNVAPLLVVTYDKSKVPKDVQKDLDEFLQDLRNQTTAVFPKEVVFDVLSKMKEGEVNSYEKFTKYLDDKISIAVLGQTLTTAHGESGSYALGAVHERIKNDILNADILMLEEFVNDFIIRPLIDFNFPNAEAYPKWKIIENKQINKKEMAEVLKIVVGDLKYPEVPKTYLHEMLEIPMLDEGELPILPPAQAPPPTFSDEHQKDERLVYLNALNNLNDKKEG